MVGREPYGWIPAFLETLRQTGGVGKACAAAGISQSSARRARRCCRAFDKAWDTMLWVYRLDNSQQDSLQL